MLHTNCNRKKSHWDTLYFIYECREDIVIILKNSGFFLSLSCDFSFIISEGFPH